MCELKQSQIARQTRGHFHTNIRVIVHNSVVNKQIRATPTAIHNQFVLIYNIFQNRTINIFESQQYYYWYLFSQIYL